MTEPPESRQTKWGTVFEPRPADSSSLRRALITGYGYTGERLVTALLASSVNVTVLVRRPEAARRAEAAGARARLVDLDTQVTADGLCDSETVLFHLVPPPAKGQRDARLRTLLGSLDATPPRRTVLVSTTGVYGNHDGALVDETTPTAPATDRARRRADAEEAAADFGARNGSETVVMRVAGIYGPHRLPLERLKKREPLPSNEHCGLTNRIHVDDLVSGLIEAARNARHGDVFNVADGNAMPMRTWFETVARLAGLEAPPLISMEEARSVLSSGLLSYLGESRRIDNRALTQKLGVSLRYASPEDGIRHALSAPD